MACAAKAAVAAPPAPPAPPAQEPAPPAPPKHGRGASNELSGLHRKLRRLIRRVDALERRDQGALDD